MNHSKSVEEIRAAMKNWSEALSRKDLEAMHKNYAKNYCLFDVQKTVKDVEGAKELWQQCFPYFDEPKIEYKDMVIDATADMAVVHFHSRIKGMSVPVPEEMANAWLRGTCCFRKQEGTWKCIHEHISFPVNCETNQIIYESD